MLIKSIVLSFIHKSTGLLFRLRWGFVIFSGLFAVYQYFGVIALLVSTAACGGLAAIGYSEAADKEEKRNKNAEIFDKIIYDILTYDIFNFFFTIKSLNDKSSRNISISLILFRSLEINNFKLIIIYFILILLAIFTYPHGYVLSACFVISCFIVLLFAKERLCGYRIKMGLFGTNSTEARALIEFIIKNSDNLDFTDSNGNLRRALLPEATESAVEPVLQPFGEESVA